MKKAKKIAWQMFRQTGKISYYLLYKAVGEDGRKTNRNRT